MATQTPFSKQSAASAIDSTHNLIRRYRENPFFRSTVNVIGLQALLAVLTVIVFAGAVQYQQNTTAEIIQERRALIAAGQTLTPESLDIRLEQVRNETLGMAFVVIVIIALVFGFLASRYALAPTQHSLEYQKRFIGNIAHELRTPLSIIRTNTEVALMDKRVTGDARETFSDTIVELDRISEIINNLLSFDSLLRPGRIKTEPVDLTNVLANVVNRHGELAQNRGIVLSLEHPEILYTIGNAIALEQVFTNLIKNALNYTPQHDDRSVTVRATDQDERVSISVIDTGIGIAQKDLYHVFEPFYRGDTSRQRRVGGGTSGLGLAIVNDIVRAHSGSIIVRSALNRGTTIEISLPKADTTQYVQERADDEDNEEHEASIVT